MHHAWRTWELLIHKGLLTNWYNENVIHLIQYAALSWDNLIKTSSMYLFTGCLSFRNHFFFKVCFRNKQNFHITHIPS